MASPVPFPFELYLQRLKREDVELVARVMRSNTGSKLPHHLSLIEHLVMRLTQRRTNTPSLATPTE